MINFSRFKTILWDFDGVLMDSMSIREEGFIRTLAGYPPHEVALLVDYHRKNGGLSRYAKFRYFFETIRQSTIEEKQIFELASDFSKMMMEMLVDSRLLIEDSINFVRDNAGLIPMHIVSGSDGTELNLICQQLNIAQYFVSIHGSPTPKIQLVQEVLKKYKYDCKDVVLVGDSMNDYEAACVNEIAFAGYNNPLLNKETFSYIHAFTAHKTINNSVK